MAAKLTIGLTLSLTGRYAAMGRQAAAALAMFAADQNAAGGIQVGAERREVAIRCLDDQSNPGLCAELYRSLCYENQADLIFGPYSSGLTRVAAPIAEQAGMVMVNHGGADDSLYRNKYRLIVGVLSPAGDYLAGLAQLVSQLKFWRKRVATVTFETPFARAVIDGFERACAQRSMRRRGVRLTVRESAAPVAGEVSIDLLLRLARSRITALASAGSFADDVALISGIVRADLNIPVLACVAAGVQGFADALGPHAEGIVGPSQWEGTVGFRPEIGPPPGPFAARMRAACGACDYPAAQIYGAGLLSAAALGACREFEAGESAGRLFRSENQHLVWRVCDRSRHRAPDRAQGAAGAVARRRKGRHPPRRACGSGNPGVSLRMAPGACFPVEPVRQLAPRSKR